MTKLRLWILEDKANVMAEHARGGSHRVEPGHAHGAAQVAARKNEASAR
jgi:hypothetical protein